MAAFDTTVTEKRANVTSVATKPQTVFTRTITYTMTAASGTSGSTATLMTALPAGLMIIGASHKSLSASGAAFSGTITYSLSGVAIGAATTPGLQNTAVTTAVPVCSNGGDLTCALTTGGANSLTTVTASFVFANIDSAVGRTASVGN